MSLIFSEKVQKVWPDSRWAILHQSWRRVYLSPSIRQVSHTPVYVDQWQKHDRELAKHGGASIPKRSGASKIDSGGLCMKTRRQRWVARSVGFAVGLRFCFCKIHVDFCFGRLLHGDGEVPFTTRRTSTRDIFTHANVEVMWMKIPQRFNNPTSASFPYHALTNSPIPNI